MIRNYTARHDSLIIIFWLLLSLFLLSAASAVFAQNGGDTGSGDWLTFRGNPEHTGQSGFTGPPEEMEMKWRWRANNELAAISASPGLMADGTVYIGTEGNIVAAINPEGGDSWIFKVDEPVLSSAAVETSGNVLFITQNGYVYYLDANGELLWKADFNMNISSSPVISGGMAFVGTDDAVLLAINLDPGVEIVNDSKRILSNVVKAWSFTTRGKVRSSPAFAGNTVFFGGGEFFYAINPNAGGNGGGEGDTGGEIPALQAGQGDMLKWQYDINADILSSPAVQGGKVYIGADDGYLYAFSENVTNDNNEGMLLWKKKTGGPVRSSPAVGEVDGTVMVYVGSDNGSLYAFEEDGELKWTFKTFGPIRSSPAIDQNGDIYFGSDDGAVYALFPDGSLKWRYQTLGAVRSSPAIGPDKTLYVGSNDGYLYCLGESDEEDREPDLQIEIAASLSSIENDGNPITISATITSESEGQNILSRIASVSIDLSPLKLIGEQDMDPNTFETEEIAKEPMLDDGKGEDNTAGDGTFTYAFGITTNILAIEFDVDNGIFTHFLSEGTPPVGPVPIMVTAEDIYGNLISKPFALNIVRKEGGGLSPGVAREFTIANRLSKQTLNILFTSGVPSILSIVPDQGAPGQIVNIFITGRNTNFTQNRTCVEIFNAANFPIAQALPENDDVEVLSDTELVASLNIINTDQLEEGNLIGRWDVIVTTNLTSGECCRDSTDPLNTCCADDALCEVVVAEDAFQISGAATQNFKIFDEVSFNLSIPFGPLQQEPCIVTLDITNDVGARPNGAPWLISSENERQIIINQADSGAWIFNILLGSCTTEEPLSFKIFTEGDNFGFLTGEVRNSITGEGIDGARIVALTGEALTQEGNATESSGGGFYMLPLAAVKEKYIVIASKDGWTDVEDDVIIAADQETQLNFSLRFDLPCPVSELVKEGSLAMFRQFRDEILVKNPIGKRWVALYYRHTREVHDILANSPELRKQSKIFLSQAAQKISGGQSFGHHTQSVLSGLLETLITKAGPELKNALEHEKESMLTFMKNEPQIRN